jgi:6-phosphogluconolactonase
MKLIITILLFMTNMAMAQHLVVGTYTSTPEEGILVYEWDAVAGKAKLVHTAKGISNPSYLVASTNGAYIYAVNENEGNAAAASAFHFDKKSGQLHFLNKQTTGGDHPCYIDINAERTLAVTANYTGGNLSVFAIAADGKLQPAAQVINHSGSSLHAERQKQPHVHTTVFSPDGQYVLVNDLGTDKLYVYPVTADAKQPLDTTHVKEYKLTPGEGPRHLAFNPKLPVVYIMNELTGNVTAFNWNNGQATLLQNNNQLIPTGREDEGGADIHITPDARFLYTTTRGKSNEISIYSIGADGQLTFKAKRPAEGIHPRNFVIDPTGKFLLVANRDSNSITVFAIDTATGLLQPTGETINVSKPVCLKFVE